MELDSQVICLVIALVVYEFMIQRSKIMFNKWAIFGIFTAFSYATISSSLYSDTNLKKLSLYIVIIVLKAIVLGALYIGARYYYFKLPEKSKNSLFYECGIVALILFVMTYMLLNQNPEVEPPGQLLDEIKRERAGGLYEASLIILGIYIFVRNWLCVKIAARKNR